MAETKDVMTRTEEKDAMVTRSCSKVAGRCRCGCFAQNEVGCGTSLNVETACIEGGSEANSVGVEQINKPDRHSRELGDGLWPAARRHLRFTKEF